MKLYIYTTAGTEVHSLELELNLLSLYFGSGPADPSIFNVLSTLDFINNDHLELHHSIVR